MENWVVVTFQGDYDPKILEELTVLQVKSNFGSFVDMCPTYIWAEVWLTPIIDFYELTIVADIISRDTKYSDEEIHLSGPRMVRSVVTTYREHFIVMMTAE